MTFRGRGGTPNSLKQGVREKRWSGKKCAVGGQRENRPSEKKNSIITFMPMKTKLERWAERKRV